MSHDADMFIVDNSDEHWKALEYVRQWCEISESVDIATGHFEIGALLALDGQWQKVNKIRLLIGGETSAQTVATVAQALDDSFEVERLHEDPFVGGVGSIVEAVRSAKIEIRVYSRKKFHAKAYITHPRLDVVTTAALVGSSNFTRPGLTKNVELNVRFGGPEVVELQNWYDQHWDEAQPVNEALLTVIEKNTREFSPFEIYARSLQALTSDVQPSDAGWEMTESKIYPLLAPYQQQAYHGLRHMADQWNGGFLTDGVGLGKTFVGLMLAEYYASRGKNVLIMAPKTGKEAVWEPELQDRLPELAGGDFTKVLVKAHTDLSTKDAPNLVKRLHDRVDVVIIDEAHNFRNHGRVGDDIGDPRSRWWRMQEICEGKTVFLLTATPINNTLFDLVHEAEMFTGMADDYFASIGVASINGYIAKLEKPFRDKADQQDVVNTGVDLSDFEELIRRDTLLESIIWQNSRKYAIESAKAAGASTVMFPSITQPHVVNYQLTLHHNHLLDELEQAFAKQAPLFTLPMYYPLAFSKDRDVDTIAENRQRQVVGLIRTTFLKRFESSVAAFAGSCLDLAAKIQYWLDANTQGDPEQAKRLTDWITVHGGDVRAVHDRYRPGQELAESAISDDMTEEEFDALEIALDPDEYELQDMIDAAFEDLDQLGKFIAQIASLSIVGDDKYARLLELLTGRRPKGDAALPPEVATAGFAKQKVLIFTEFADTARYLHDQLTADSVADVDRLDGTRKANRVQMIRRFAPFYNNVSDQDRKAQAPLRILISTDVLSEGVNLQDGTLVINYDLHWNPVRLMQRIGRVDRRMDPRIEKALIKATPSAKADRGVIQVRNFLAPDALERLLRLNQRVQSKVLLISKTLGIPGGKLLTADDMLDDVKVMQAFKDDYEGSLSAIETLRLKYQQMIAADPTLVDRLREIPLGARSGKAGEPTGVFACRIHPRAVRITDTDGKATTEWTLEGGPVTWMMDAAGPTPVADLVTMDAAISAEPTTPRAEPFDPKATRASLRALESSDTKDYQKLVQLPLDAPLPKTICWMDVR